MKDTKICLHDFLCFSSFDELCEPQKVFLRLCRIQAAAKQTFVFLRTLTSKAPAKQVMQRVSAALRV